MMSNESKCPFCRSSVEREPCPSDSVWCYIKHECPYCGVFFLWSGDLNNGNTPPQTDTARIAALLCERHLQGLPIPILQFRNETYPPLAGPISLPVKNLLAKWPNTPPERLERAFCNLVRYGGVNRVGEQIELEYNAIPSAMLFASSPDEARYYLSAFCDFGWMATDRTNLGKWSGCVTPAGWGKFDELTRTQANIWNPVFVAMWFGGDKTENRNKQTELFEKVILATCKKLNWLADRVDSQEHNDSIIDRIIAMIRTAPFMIADLSDENKGAYYEAGFARGLGIDVIYLVKEGSTPHFDVSGVNHVRWRDDSELAGKLENRMLGTMGRGPHNFA